MLKNSLGRIPSKRRLIDARVTRPDGAARLICRRNSHISEEGDINSGRYHRLATANSSSNQQPPIRSNSHQISSTSSDPPLPAIGLELHVQLASDSKLFSSANPPTADQDSNTNLALFDAATPGTQPVLSSDCLRLALIASLALECKINRKTSFDRKHYFYPDLPAGYQITQHYSPIASDGKVLITPEDGADRSFEVRITQLQLEQDTGKSTIDPLYPGQTLIDLNRSGVALIEIVTGPDLRTAKEASIFVRKLQSILRFAGVTKGNMEQGSLRCDLNVSISQSENSTIQGSRCEVKNVNGFGHIEHAIDFEISRQRALVAEGQRVEMETRGFDVARRQTFRLRDKESQTDYRYLPDPDLPPIIFPPAILERLRNMVPELPHPMARRLQESYGLSRTIAEVLMMIGSERIDHLADVGCGVRYFEAAMDASSVEVEGKTMANWIVHELLGLLAKFELRFVDCPVCPKEFGELVGRVSNGTLLRPIAREILSEAIKTPTISLKERLEKNQMKSQNNKEEGRDLESPVIKKLVQEIMSEMPKEVELIRNGRPQIIAKLVGEGMRRSQKSVDPRLLRTAFEEELLPHSSAQSS
ncbi:hypothetical protein PGT21_009291 [Puccinia graminis f. sp. tritici]|uniref:Glutamyl-tRNA(Gln) amidotransferase subunit B, mitochondrial n=2 Tax=Puccinia graminis f. sp. tritici TaxID=56615 RepID=E3JW55_PUCGT|nr:uncharacterized protein PGTG_02721 [Puccinia graminis f. sp. tritici CRL 75-36-700-3]EFP76280.2 hypothetical protein PGTG_02721 [Puccinia graminis f. sp. tritici CRL 75-36-700-3]KAA1117493.1 hypothetical protein PGT21_009291 [Puccinia graminis f. sp. tritici]